VPDERIKYIKPDNWELFIDKIPNVALSILTVLLAGISFKK